MKPIQPILTLILIFILFRFVGKMRKNYFARLIVFLMITTGILFIAFPTWTAVLAQAVGVTRGVDLVLYVVVSMLLFFSTMFYLRIKELETKIANAYDKPHERFWASVNGLVVTHFKQTTDPSSAE